MAALNKEEIIEAYEDVRDDHTESNWVIFDVEGNTISKGLIGVEYDEFKEQFNEGNRAFGFVRVMTGDEMSKRAKFALITWCGQSVMGMQRAKMGTFKNNLKSLVKSVTVDIQAEEMEEIDEEKVREAIMKAGGANYGTGSRD